MTHIRMGLKKPESMLRHTPFSIHNTPILVPIKILPYIGLEIIKYIKDKKNMTKLLNKIPDIAYSIEGDLIEIEQSTGCGEFTIVELIKSTFNYSLNKWA